MTEMHHRNHLMKAKDRYHSVGDEGVWWEYITLCGDFVHRDFIKWPVDWAKNRVVTCTACLLIKFQEDAELLIAEAQDG